MITTRKIHHVNCDFTFQTVEKQFLINGKVFFSQMSNVLILK